MTPREREIVGLLAEGLTGAEIAAKLVVAEHTVRTHVRNAMRKLGASTRSHAVVLAVQQGQIGGGGGASLEWQGRPSADSAPARDRTAEVDRALDGMLASLCSLPDVADGLVMLVEEDGLTLRRAAVASAGDGAIAREVPERLALGEGALGKVALNRRAALLPRLASGPSSARTALAAPIVANGRLLGVLTLTTRASRPTGQSELLVLQALVNRIAEILRAGQEVDRRLEATAERFRASWSAATG